MMELVVDSKAREKDLLEGVKERVRWSIPHSVMDTIKIKTDNINDKPLESEFSCVKIKILFFARARDLTGLTEMPLELSSGSTTRDCLNKLVAKFPCLEEIRGCIVLALNEEYTTEDSVVKEKDELAIIPPISGG
ncbi:hypothetical protein GH714_011097 [Hevea brasiliensis]|uniref:Molybdopterin synthase sulfur carrier subunit n=1 Tax=Hevea brasiliensis TaxID=3981 RepID=A0A6A6KE07_HEVBR|nr:hypothetical protein GH714_011097 [Hevea brasiliensis]